MKTLFISDLDGTLLNTYAEISGNTREIVNTLLAGGMYFSVATARTSATVSKLLDGIPINVPVILMNGVCIYDLQTNSYIQTESISIESKYNLLKIVKKHALSGFIYTIDADGLSTYFENTDSPNAKEFMEERERKYQKKFTKVEDFSECISNNIVYYSISDTKNKLEAAYQESLLDANLHAEFYKDIYHEDFWYLEICSRTASKYNAVRYLRDHYGFQKVIGFGDNLNDLPLFAACDECYAVKNAKPEIKRKATSVIDSNHKDGVAEWIKANYVQKMK